MWRNNGQTTYCSKECILYPVGNREAFSVVLFFFVSLLKLAEITNLNLYVGTTGEHNVCQNLQIRNAYFLQLMPRSSDAANSSFLKAPRHSPLTLHFAPRLTAGKSKEAGRRWGWFREGREETCVASLPLCESNSTLFIPGCKRQTCSDLPPSFGKPPETPQTQTAKFATNVLAAKLTP